MTESEERELLEKTRAIYHHLGLDGERPASISHIREEAKKDVLKFRLKHIKKEHERATP